MHNRYVNVKQLLQLLKLSGYSVTVCPSFSFFGLCVPMKLVYCLQINKQLKVSDMLIGLIVLHVTVLIKTLNS